MIKLTRLNDEEFLVNFFQIEYVESIPETKVKLMNGEFFLVKDSAESISQKVTEFLGNCFSQPEKVR